MVAVGSYPTAGTSIVWGVKANGNVVYDVGGPNQLEWVGLAAKRISIGTCNIPYIIASGTYNNLYK